MLGNKKLKLAIAGGSDAGKQRDHNEDAYAIAAARGCAIVADGMGGLARGEVASRLVVETVIEAIGAGQSLEQGLLLAHQRVLDASLAAGQERMGSTAVALSIEGNKATICWVGDSRAYLWRADALTQLTKDHSFVNDLIDAGAIDAHEADTHPNRHVLTRAIGIRDSVDVKIDVLTQKLRQGDRLLLCSDGLYGYLPRASLKDCLRSAPDAGAMVRQLIERTLRESEAGDNITAVCVMVKD